MDTFENRPVELKEKFFDILFKLMEIANFAPDERVKYQHEMTTERDRQNQLDYARKVAMEKGMEKGREEVARSMIANGISLDLVSKCTGFSVSELSSW